MRRQPRSALLAGLPNCCKRGVDKFLRWRGAVDIDRPRLRGYFTLQMSANFARDLVTSVGSTIPANPRIQVSWLDGADRSTRASARTVGFGRCVERRLGVEAGNPHGAQLTRLDTLLGHFNFSSAWNRFRREACSPGKRAHSKHGPLPKTSGLPARDLWRVGSPAVARRGRRSPR